MKIKTVISCLLFFTSMAVAAIAIADEPGIEQFAKGYELKTDGSAAIYKLNLPESIYQTTVRKDLGDIRVFNKDKKACAPCHQATCLKPGKRSDSSGSGLFPITWNR